MAGCLYKIGYWFWVVFYYTLGFSWYLLFEGDSGGFSWDNYLGEPNKDAFFWRFFCSIYWSLHFFFGPLKSRGFFRKNLKVSAILVLTVFAIPLSVPPNFAYPLLLLLPVPFRVYSSRLRRSKEKREEAEKRKKAELDKKKEKEEEDLRKYKLHLKKLEEKKQKEEYLKKKQRELSTILEEVIKKEVKPDLIDLKSGQAGIIGGQESILKSLSGIINEVSIIKNSSKKTEKDLELAIEKMNKTIDERIVGEDYENYIDKVLAWFNHWGSVGKKTKVFMPGAEFLLENIENSRFEDYSAFVLYYCRSLENELLNKIFISFIDHFNKIEDSGSLFDWEKDGLSPGKSKQYERFFKDLERKIRAKKFTLGEMKMVLEKLPYKNSKAYPEYHRSPLLKEFYSFIKTKSLEIDKETVLRLSDLNVNFRRRSAHVDIIEKEAAYVFYQEFKALMNKIISQIG